MAEIIPLRGSAHEQVQQLLPWYTNGTLDADEAARVESHLADCAECRAEAEADAAFAREVATLDLSAHQGWAALDARLDQARPRSSPVALLRHRVPVSWMLAGQAAAVVLAIVVAIPLAAPAPTYHALGSAPANEAGNVVIVFQPEVSERDMRTALLRSDARVVDGPNASGAYVIRVPQSGRQTALQRLRGMPQVMLAEPIDPESPQ